jgi:IS4 transposase
LDVTKWGNETDFGQFVYNNLFSSEQRMHMRAIKDFLPERSSFTVRRVQGHDANFTVQLGITMPWPELSSAVVTTAGGSMNRWDVNLEGDVWDDLTAEIVKRNNNVKRVTEERETFVKGVEVLINRHTTLAPALREWKPLWDLLPEETKERHKKKVVRKRSEAQVKAELEAEGIDLNKMTSVVGMNRLTGGNS